MSPEDSTGLRTRRVIQRALRFMNKHELTEFEYEEKESDQTLVLKRSDGSSSPPMLEGRSETVEADVRAPAVGTLSWDREEGDRVEAGEVLGTVEKYDEEVEVVAPRAGIFTDPAPEEHVGFSQFLAEIQPESEPAEDDDSVDSEGSDS